MTKIETNSRTSLRSIAAMNEELIQLNGVVQVMKKLSTLNGFYAYYLNEIKNFKDHQKTFDYVNSLYCFHFGVKRFQSYEYFKINVQSKIKEVWKV